jgi:hypothetical protein
VVEARGAEAVTKTLVETLVLAEHDAGENGAPFTGWHGLERVGDSSAETVRDAADSVPTPHDSVAARAQHDVDSLASEVPGLAGRRPGRERDVAYVEAERPRGSIGTNWGQGPLRHLCRAARNRASAGASPRAWEGSNLRPAD